MIVPLSVNQNKRMYGMRNAIENKGQFVLSLDFELLWGVWDITTKEKYGDNIVGVQQVIPRLLSLFEAFHIKATFATVGFLFNKDKSSLLQSLPAKLPSYSNESFNVYQKELPLIGENEKDDPYHFGYPLLELLKNSSHEIGTHTYSHYYCLEDGQTAAEFMADIQAVQSAGQSNDIAIKSFVFPRNQVNESYLPLLHDNKIIAYRGNPDGWIYKPRKFSAEIPFIRLCRLIDTYIPISGKHSYDISAAHGIPVNIPASRFLKPYRPTLRFLEKLRMRRIKREMKKAAEKNQLYHLWWHPHNFGVNLEENIYFLSCLLQYYKELNKRYGFTNVTMEEAALTVQNQH